MGFPSHPKVHFRPLGFCEGPTLVPVFTNQKKSKEDFRFYEKKVKSENSIIETAAPQAVRAAPPGPFPWDDTQLLSIPPP